MRQYDGDLEEQGLHKTNRDTENFCEGKRGFQNTVDRTNGKKALISSSCKNVKLFLKNLKVLCAQK